MVCRRGVKTTSSRPPNDGTMSGVFRKTLTRLGGGGQFPHPKYVWSPAGGWWGNTKDGPRNTVIAAGIVVATSGAIWSLGSSLEVGLSYAGLFCPCMVLARDWELFSPFVRRSFVMARPLLCWQFFLGEGTAGVVCNRSSPVLLPVVWPGLSLRLRARNFSLYMICGSGRPPRHSLPPPTFLPRLLALSRPSYLLPTIHDPLPLLLIIYSCNLHCHHNHHTTTTKYTTPATDNTVPPSTALVHIGQRPPLSH